MSFGLQVWYDGNQMMIDEDTYTIRLVDTIYCSYGDMRPNQTITVPNSKAKGGMFAIASPLKKWSKSYGIGVRVGGVYRNQGVSTPSCSVVEGAVQLKAASTPRVNSDSATSGNVIIYLFSNK